MTSSMLRGLGDAGMLVEHKKNDLYIKKIHLNDRARQTQKCLRKTVYVQKRAEIMMRLRARAQEQKEVRKGMVFESKPQSRPRLKVRKHTWLDPKITQYENNRISVGKPNKSA